jgi:dolichyl-phosphate-mannose-protein mannosyltransferase
MQPVREQLIGLLVGAKLRLRRAVRRWRAARNAGSGVGFVGLGSGSGAALLSTGGDRDAHDAWPSPGKVRAAQLPAAPPDHAPALLPAALFVLALAVRGWRIEEPRAIVFDELHFGKFLKAYWTGSYYFDIHPPLGKLILFLVSRIFSTHAPKSEFASIGADYAPDDGVFAPIRWSSAVFGSCTPPITYIIARELGLSLPASLVPALALVFDNLVIVESRLILMDAQLLCFMAACLLCALRMWGAGKRTGRRRAYLVATAVFGALALSVKWTALATPGIVAVVSLVGWPFPAQGMLEPHEMLIAGTLAFTVYATFFFIHFRMLPNTGSGDKFMTNEFQRTLVGSPTYNASAPAQGFVRNFLYINARMLSASASIKTRHTWESKWYQWIITYRGVLYSLKSSNDKEHGQLVSKVYLIANPAVAYAALVAVLGIVVVFVAVYLPKRRARRLSPYDRLHGYVQRGGILLAGYALNLIPYIAVERCTFLYHYVPALFYGELLLANSVNALAPRNQWPVAALLIFTFVAAYVRWSPWIYSVPLDLASHNRLALYGSHWQ